MTFEFTFHPSPFSGASIQKREAIVGRLDRSLDLFGIRLGIQYKDPSDRTKGGKLDFAIDDMKAYFPKAHSSAIELNLAFDGGDNNRDGLFDFSINYKLTHADGDGDETGFAQIARMMEGGRWVTTIKTKTTGNIGGAAPIIPARISNLDFSMSSDRQTAFNLRYLNPSAGRDLKVVATRNPGKSAHIVIDRDGETVQDLTFSAKDFDLKNVDGNFEIGVSGTSRGLPLKGSIKGEANAKGNRVKVEFERGNKKVVQIDSKIKKNIPKLYFETMTKYSLLGGAVQGQIKMKFEDGQLNLKNEAAGETIELRVKIVPGQSADIECKKNGESMWSYKTQRTTVNTPEKFEMDLVTDLTLNSKSMVWAFLDKNYPYGAFNVRKNTLKVFVDRQNYNKFLPKFNIDLKLFKEGQQVVDLTIDSRSKPYKFLFVAPNVFNRWNIPYDKIEATLAHDIGSKVVFHTNIGGGIDIEGSRGDNAKGGRDIHILTKKAGKQMMKVDISTEKQINDDQILIKLHDSVEIDNDSALYRRLVGNYRFLTPFNKRTGEYELFVNKKEKNVLLNKFYVKGQVMKDGQKVMNMLVTTNEKPYRVELFLPALLNKIYSDMDEYKMTVEHNPGQLLNVVTNGKKFKGFKISRTGNGNEREIEINGKKLGSGDYTLTDNSFSTKITNAAGDWLEPKITWEGALPKNKDEAANFFAQNNVKVHATGSKRNFDIDLSWKATKPDWDWSTPESMKMNLNIKGKGPRWGDYRLSRDVAIKVENKIIEWDLSGESHFGKGLMATATPIMTEIHLKYLIPQGDLQGKLSKVINGKEYSIDFPAGRGVMPAIRMGV